MQLDSSLVPSPIPPPAALRGVDLALSEGLVSAADGLKLLGQTPHLLCNVSFVVERLGAVAQAAKALILSARETKHFDVAELFVFVCPARMATPTPRGLALSLALEPHDDDLVTLALIAQDLLHRLENRHYPLPRETFEIANFLNRSHWPWAPQVIAALKRGHADLSEQVFATGLNVWDRLPEWEDKGPRNPGLQEPVNSDEATKFLSEILGSSAERRISQNEYAASVTFAFKPRERRSENNILLAEAGTGLGKTLGYLAPAYLWARRNHAPVWISTYTKNLQRQLDQESARLVPDPVERQNRIVIRKGRENYLCLLNLQETVGRLGAGNLRNALLAALIVRWARFSRDGDMVGGDFPSWLLSLFPDLGSPLETRSVSPASLGLTDRRGECLFAACSHFKKCFIERNIRNARWADIVVANHALVMTQAATDYALGEPVTAEEDETPGGMRRLVFDEGHHLFDAADQAFSSHLTALETTELRRWLRGPETDRRRGRGLRERMRDLVDQDEALERLLTQLLAQAACLPGPGWTQRIASDRSEGATEEFLSLLRVQVLARTEQSPQANSLECDCLPAVAGLLDAAQNLSQALEALRQPMAKLAKLLMAKLDNDADKLSSYDRGRLEAIARSLKKRGEMAVGGWVAMLQRLQTTSNPLFVAWFAVEQAASREMDYGFHSHWIDPTEPLALAVLKQADGVVITSATLKDRPPDVPDDWSHAEMRTGAAHLPYPVKRLSYDSPFDYPARSVIFVVNDVNRDDMAQVSAAYRELFIAAGGGALGLFTAISRLKAVHRQLIKPLAQAGLPLYAQHVDPMDTGTLVDIFRSERDACLLGTDAVRDGVDVPGPSLRLIVLDRVPWNTPSILDRARRELFGGAAYTDMVVRLRLRQGFGRLIRSARDRGCFVILDPRLASRFITAFPPGVKIIRTGLVETIEGVKNFNFGRLDK